MVPDGSREGARAAGGNDGGLSLHLAASGADGTADREKAANRDRFGSHRKRRTKPGITSSRGEEALAKMLANATHPIPVASPADSNRRFRLQRCY